MSAVQSLQAPYMIDVREVAEILSISTRSVWRLVASRDSRNPFASAAMSAGGPQTLKPGLKPATTNLNGNPRRSTMTSRSLPCTTRATMIAGGRKMASVRRLSRDRNKKGAPYYIQFLDQEGKRRTTRGCPDKGVSEAKAATIETVVQRIKIGLADRSELDELLGKPQSDAWEEQLKAFEASLKRKNNTSKHVHLTVNRVKLILTGSEFKSLADFDADAAETFLAKHCQEEDLGHRTYNHYLQAVDSFGNWLSIPNGASWRRIRLPGFPVEMPKPMCVMPGEHSPRRNCPRHRDRTRQRLLRSGL